MFLLQPPQVRQAEVFTRMPERFPHGVPTPPPLPAAAWINKPASVAPVASNPHLVEPTTADDPGPSTIILAQ